MLIRSLLSFSLNVMSTGTTAKTTPQMYRNGMSRYYFAWSISSASIFSCAVSLCQNPLPTMFLTYFAKLLSSYVARPILNLEIISTVAASVRLTLHQEKSAQAPAREWLRPRASGPYRFLSRIEGMHVPS